METKLGEIDRARAIYSHTSQMCDPRVTTDFWQLWKEFEVKHGNEDTLREMLRIKRSVQAVYNTQVNIRVIIFFTLTDLLLLQVNMMASAMMQEGQGGLGTVADLAPSLTMGLKDDMWRLEAKGAESDVKKADKQSNILFVRGETQSKAVEDMVTADNPDEIDISEDEDEEEEAMEPEKEKRIVNVEEMDVPDKVFGGLKKASQDDEN